MLQVECAALEKNRCGQAPDHLLLAARATCREGVAGTSILADTLLERPLRHASASPVCQTAEDAGERPGHSPVSSYLTNYH